MGFLDRARARLDAILRAPATAAERAAPRIEAKLQADATTRRGNLPQFGPGAQGHPGGYVPISARAVPGGVDVHAAGWVLDKAREKGQPVEWAEIMREELRRGQ